MGGCLQGVLGNKCLFIDIFKNKFKLISLNFVVEYNGTMAAEKGRACKDEEVRQMSETEKNNFWGSIKGNIISYVAICTAGIIVVTATLNSLVMRNVLVTNGHNMLMKEAENAGELMNEWLVRQADIVDTMKSGLETMDRDDMEAVMDYLNANLSRNEDALMYY